MNTTMDVLTQVLGKKLKNPETTSEFDFHNAVNQILQTWG
jgi:hypothetical protein